MKCDNCLSDRILSVAGKTGDLFNAEFKNTSYEGYVPSDIGIGDGDVMILNICLNCGKVQGIKNAKDPKFYTDAKEMYEEASDC